MIGGFAVLLGFQLGGEALAHLLHVPIPGPVIGLLMLFGWLRMRSFTDLDTPQTLDRTELAQLTGPLLRNLGILFVPSGVGVLEYVDLFVARGPAVLLVLVVSTLLTMIVTALAFAGVQSLAARIVIQRRTRLEGDAAASAPQPSESPNLAEQEGLNERAA